MEGVWAGVKFPLLSWLVSLLCGELSEQQNKRRDGWTSLHLHLIILSPSLCQEFTAPPTWSLQLLFGGTGVTPGREAFPVPWGFVLQQPPNLLLMQEMWPGGKNLLP